MSAIWWEPKVVEMPSLELSRESEKGYMKASWGQVAFVPDAFPGAPPRKTTINLDWGMTYAGSVRVFDGTIVLRKQTPKKIMYDIFEPEFKDKLLDSGINTNGEACTKPLVIGSVEYMSPQRTGAVAEQKYYLPAFSGAIGSGINAYDDGVLINDHWVDNGDGTVSRTVNIVGELTFSGTGTMTNLGELFAWGSSVLGLELRDELAKKDMPIDVVVTNQQYLIDFLSSVAWYCDHGFYIKEGILYLVSNDLDNGSQLVDIEGGDFEPISIVPSWAQPIKKYSAKWGVRYAKVDENGSRIETKDLEAEVLSDFTAVGTEKTATKVYNFDIETVKKRLQVLLDRGNLPQITLDIPFVRLPGYGERIDFSNTLTAPAISGFMHVRKIHLDYKGRALNVTGDGEVNYL